MSKQNKVAKLLKTLAVSSLCMAMIFPVGTINASSQNVESENTINSNQNDVNHVSTTQELKSQEQNLLNQIQTKINSHGGLLKISPKQLKEDIESIVYFNSQLSNKIFKFEMSAKNFYKSIKSKGGYKKLTLVQIRAELAKYFAYDHDLQDKLFYEIRSQLLSSKNPAIISAVIGAVALMSPHVQGWIDNSLHVGDHKWTHSNGHWWYCNGWGQYCATGWVKLHSSHQNYHHGGNRWYLFSSNHALNEQSGWKKYNNHYMYNDGAYGFYTNEGGNVQKNNYTNQKGYFRFNNNGYKF